MRDSTLCTQSVRRADAGDRASTCAVGERGRCVDPFPYPDPDMPMFEVRRPPSTTCRAGLPEDLPPPWERLGAESWYLRRDELTSSINLWRTAVGWWWVFDGQCGEMPPVFAGKNRAEALAAVQAAETRRELAEQYPENETEGAEVGGPTPEQEAHAWAAHDEMLADQRAAMREALTLLLERGPDALTEAEERLRDRIDNDALHTLGDVVRELHPERPGIGWYREGDGVDA